MSGGTGVGLGELVKYPLPSLLGNANAGVFNADTHLIRVYLGGGNDNAADLGEFDRVADKVGNDLPNFLGVTPVASCQCRLGYEVNLQSLALGCLTLQVADFVDQTDQVELDSFHLDSIGFYFGQVEYFTDQVQQGLARVKRGPCEALLLRRGVGFQQQFVHADDAMQGRANFMAHDGQELGFGDVGRFCCQLRFFEIHGALAQPNSEFPFSFL